MDSFPQSVETPSEDVVEDHRASIEGKELDQEVLTAEEPYFDDQFDGTSDRKPRVKAEAPSTAQDGNAEEATQYAIANAQNEFTTRERPIKSQVEEESPPMPEQMPKPPRKRPAPKAAGSKRPPSKKLKTDPSDDRGTPGPARRSATPTTKSLKSKGRKGSHSATPFSSSPPARSPSPFDMDDVEDPNILYCICRRPDNHTFMIACDGGCDDWYHGKCVNFKKEDEELVDKYICPICEANGDKVTTWKPMCRKPGCRQPARLDIKKGVSKYCSDECGRAFFQDKVGRTGISDTPQRAQPKGRRASKNSKSETNDIPRDPSPDLGPMGGPIRPHELKALTAAAPNASTFRHLGDSSVLTPPPSESPDTLSDSLQVTPIYTPLEEARLSYIAARKDVLRQRRTLLKDREHFVVLAKERAARLAESTDMKELCGMDARLSWDDKTFELWRDSEAGKAAFERNSLDVPAADEAEDEVAGEKTKDLKPRPAAINRASSATGAPASNVVEGEVCMRKRCERHRTWQKLVLQDVRFEEADVGDEMRRIDTEEGELRQRAMTRARMRRSGVSLEEEGGSVEIVGDDGDGEGDEGVAGSYNSDGDADGDTGMMNVEQAGADADGDEIMHEVEVVES